MACCSLPDAFFVRCMWQPSSGVYFGMRTQDASPVMVLRFEMMFILFGYQARLVAPLDRVHSCVVGFAWQTGIAWFSGHQLEKWRHQCRDSDRLKNWGWQRHDGRYYGEQQLQDPDNDVVASLCLQTLSRTRIFGQSTCGTPAQPLMTETCLPPSAFESRAKT
jgi:hypothetical protein